MGPRAGQNGRKVSSPPGFDPGPSSPVAQSLYRLSYRAHIHYQLLTEITKICENVIKIKLDTMLTRQRKIIGGRLVHRLRED